MTELEELRRIGDQMQSAASRIATYIRVPPREVPYEVAMAAAEALDAVDEWTSIRREAARV